MLSLRQPGAFCDRNLTGFDPGQVDKLTMKAMRNFPLLSKPIERSINYACANRHQSLPKMRRVLRCVPGLFLLG
jgi:hypothetical protein